MAFSNNSLIKLNSATYAKLLFIIIPTLNFLSGINIDLYAPSLPAISTYFSASPAIVKSSISISMLGFAIGCLVFGSLFQTFSKRSIILLGLLFYTITSLAALICQNIEQFLLIRFLQGFLVSIMSVGSRVIMLENFSGHRLKVGLLYISLAFSCGPIVAPFIGGILQYHFGWHANFWAYAIASFTAFIFFGLFINDKIIEKKIFSAKKLLSDYSFVIRNKIFLSAVFIVACAYSEGMIFPTVGAFIVENVLGRSSIIYGNAALLISCGYFIGTFSNRFLIKGISMLQLTGIGFLLLIIASCIQLCFALFLSLSLWTLTLPIFLIGFSLGFTNNNILVLCFENIAYHASIVGAAFLSLQLIFAAIILFIVSHIHVEGLVNLVIIFSVLTGLQLFLYYKCFKPAILAKFDELKDENF